MKTIYILVCCLLVTTACSPSLAEPTLPNELPSPLPTHTSAATKISAPSATVATTIATSAPQPSPTPCPDITHTPAPTSTGLLRIVYSSDSATRTWLWLWKEETQTATPFPLPEDALDPHLSSDHRLIAFLRVRENGESEIWVVDTEGCHARKLASVTLDEAKQRATGLLPYLDLGWVPNTHMIVYHIQSCCGVGGDGTYAQTTLVDAETGNVIEVLPPAHWLTYAPDGSQMAALTYDELRVYDTQDGQLQFSLKFGGGGHWYSPDGQYILVLSSQGFIGVNAANGTWREIPLAYESIGGCGDVVPPPPDITWIDIDEASYFMLVPEF